VRLKPVSVFQQRGAGQRRDIIHFGCGPFIFNYVIPTTWNNNSLTWNRQSGVVTYASETLTIQNTTIPSFADPMIGQDQYGKVNLGLAHVNQAISNYGSKEWPPAAVLIIMS